MEARVGWGSVEIRGERDLDKEIDQEAETVFALTFDASMSCDALFIWTSLNYVYSLFLN